MVFLGDEASNDSGVIENVDFQDFRTLRLRNLRRRVPTWYAAVRTFAERLRR